jgi:hypothetical protein
LFSKKKIKLYNILLTSLIIFFSIPIKILKIFYYFIIKNTKSFKEGLEILYYHLFYSVKESKIEILNKKIYINCFTIGKLLYKSNVKNLSEQKIFNFIHDLKIIVDNFNSYEELNQEIIKMELSQITTQEGTTVANYHYTYKNFKNTMHPTSNIVFKIQPSQKIDTAMPGAIKEGSKKPGTIITQNIAKITGSGKFL